MGRSIRTWCTGSVWALVPASPFGSDRGEPIQLFTTEGDAKRARKFAGGTGRIEEVPVRSVETGGGPF